MLLVAVLLGALRTSKHWTYFYEFLVVELSDDGKVFSPLGAAFFGLPFLELRPCVSGCAN